MQTMIFRPKKIVPPPEIGGVRVKPSARARRFSLRTDARTGEVVLVFPPRGSEKRGLAFIKANEGWIETQRKKRKDSPAFGHGAPLSLLGRAFTLDHRPGRGISRIEGDRIVIHGEPAHLKRRLRDFLKKEAQAILSARTREKTESLGLKMYPVRMRDPKTRWGSCGRDGRIMYSWRLILAPEAVLDYVVAHEVAHRVHMDHSRKFWTLCAGLTTNAVAARRWLREHGPALMAMA